MSVEYYLVIVEKQQTFELGKGPWQELNDKFANEEVCLEFDYQQLYEAISCFDTSDLWKIL